MINVQTGNMLDVVVEGKSIGLKPRGRDDVWWLPEPEGLQNVLAAEIKRLNPNRVHSPTGRFRCESCPHTNPPNPDGSCSAYGYNGVDCQAQPCICRNHVLASTGKVSEEDEAFALKLYEALAVNDDINAWHKDALLPMIAKIASEFAATVRKEAAREEFEQIDRFRASGCNVTFWCTPRAVVTQITFHDNDASPDIDK